MDYCLECGHELGQKQIISCDVCGCSVHRTCGTGNKNLAEFIINVRFKPVLININV